MPECFQSRRLRLILFAACLSGCVKSPDPELSGIARLPADTFIEGPSSGQFIEPANGRTPPFVNAQPVQGFSALLAEDDGSFLALPDNGFGTRENSADYVLRVFRIAPDLRTAAGGSGTMDVTPEFELGDPDGHVKWPIVADLAFYPETAIRVDTLIASRRLLTGADFDVESFRRIHDGTYYFGDEFGPFLLHTDATGRLLESPISLPGVWSPQHPELGDREPNLPRSSGFEGMALSTDGSTLYPMLEKPLHGDDGLLRIYAFNIESGSYAHTDPTEYAHLYRLSPEAQYAPEFTFWHGDRYLIIERDRGQGATAKFKRVFSVDFGRQGEDGTLVKTELIDLLDIADPDDLAGDGTGRFSFPYETTEALDALDEETVAIINDNNYPFGQGRNWKEGEPDGSELILIGGLARRD